MANEEAGDKARESFEKHGFTIGVYFPPEADWERVQAFFDRVTKLAYEGFFPNREGWDPFVCGHARDLLGVDSRRGHIYLSTGCLHGNHKYCQGKEGLVSPKTPAVCKFCGSPCICPCHQEKEKTPLTAVPDAVNISEEKSKGMFDGECAPSEGRRDP